MVKRENIHGMGKIGKKKTYRGDVMDKHLKELYALCAGNRQEFMIASAESKDVNVICLRAFCLYDGVGVAKDVSQALDMIGCCLDEVSSAAANGDVEAQASLGRIYRDGLCVEKDEVEAVEWYRKAAEQGHARAQNNLGVMYACGRGVEKEEAEAVAWYRKAAEQEYAATQFNLGVMYANGRGVEKDDVQAVEWYRKAAEQGNATARRRLGDCYENEKGV